MWKGEKKDWEVCFVLFCFFLFFLFFFLTCNIALYSYWLVRLDQIFVIYDYMAPNFTQFKVFLLSFFFFFFPPPTLCYNYGTTIIIKLRLFVSGTHHTTERVPLAQLGRRSMWALTPQPTFLMMSHTHTTCMAKQFVCVNGRNRSKIFSFFFFFFF